jgi:choice-of-anchor C domain-containing protein
LVNGGFEEGPKFTQYDWCEVKNGSKDIIGWKVNNSVLFMSGWQHAGGKRSILLQGERNRGGIEQILNTVKGWRYRVSFALSANPNAGRWTPDLIQAGLEVSAAGKSQQFTFDCTGNLEDHMGWVTNEWEFEATGDRTTLAFSATEAKGFWHGPALDNVRVVAIPPPNLLVNGSFEAGDDLRHDPYDWREVKPGSTAITGWKVNNSVLLLTGWQHADGNRSLLLQGETTRGEIEQAFKTTKGQRYRVSFALAANPNAGRWPPEMTRAGIEVRAAGKSQTFTFDCTGKMEYDMGWVTRTWEFEATEAHTTLAFAATAVKGFWFGPALDNVRVWAVADDK